MKNERALFQIPIKELAVTLPGAIKEERIARYSKSKYTVTVVTYGYTARILNGNILEVTVFNHKNGAAEYRIFIGDYDYVSQVYDKKSREWRRSTSKLSKWYYTVTNDYQRHLTDEQSRAEAMKWLGAFEQNNPDIFRRISLYVDNIGKQKLKDKHDRIRESIDDIMLQIRPIPKDFDKWADEVAFRENRYIMYQYSRKKETDGYCTHCKQHVRVTGAKHKQRGVCPACKSPITFLAEGKTSGLDVNKNLIYFQSGADGEIIFRIFNENRTYFPEYGRLEVRTCRTEVGREFYFANKVYDYTNFCNTSEVRWCNSYENHLYSTGYIYHKNIKKLFEKVLPNHKNLQYIPFTQLLKNLRPVNAAKFYTSIIKYPQIEMLAKFGLYKMCEEIINDYYYSNLLKDEEFFKKYKLKNADIKLIKKHDMGIEKFKLYKECKKYGEETLNQIMKWYDKGYTALAERFCKILPYMPYQAAEAYAHSQIKEFKKSRNFWGDNSNPRIMEEVLSDWQDYIENAKELGWNLKDTKVLKPKSLIQRHDYTTDLMKLRENKVNDKNIQERYYDSIFKFGYSDKKFSVIVPRNLIDLKNEGDSLKHCVYTNYSAKVADGRSTILFIRENEHFYKSLATAEINPKTYEVIQIRGYKNSNVTPDVKKFFEKYKKEVLEKLKKNERKAA